MTILYQELNHVLICFDHGSHVEGFRCTAEVLPFRNKPHRYHSSVDSLSSSWPWMMPSVKLSVWSNSWSADQRYLDQYLLYNTIFSGMNIHKSQLFWCSPGVLLVLTHCHLVLESQWSQARRSSSRSMQASLPSSNPTFSFWLFTHWHVIVVDLFRSIFLQLRSEGYLCNLMSRWYQCVNNVTSCNAHRDSVDTCPRVELIQRCRAAGLPDHVLLSSHGRCRRQRFSRDPDRSVFRGSLKKS